MASRPQQRAAADEAVAYEQAATLAAEATRLAELVAVVTRLAAARPCDPSALRSALVALIDSGFSDITLNNSWRMLTTALNAMSVHRLDVVVRSAVLRVLAAFANLNADCIAAQSLDGEFARLVDLMDTNRALLSVQMDCIFALADYLFLSAELARLGASKGAFLAVYAALRQHGAALVSVAEPALNRVLLSATTFLSARHVTEYNDFVGTVGAIALVLAHSKDAGAVKQALEVLSFCCCDGSEALLTLEPAKAEPLATSLLYTSLKLCLINHATDRGVVLSLLDTLISLAAVSYHRLQDNPRAAEVSLAVSELIVRITLANAGDGEVQGTGYTGLYILCLGCGFPQCPRQMSASSFQSAISSGAVVPLAAAVRSQHCNEIGWFQTANLLSRFFQSGNVDVAPFADLLQVCVEALDRLLLLTEDTSSHVHSHALACGSGLLGVMFARSPNCKALGRQMGAAKTLAAVHANLEQCTDLPDGMKTIALRALLQLLDPEESATLQSSLPSAGAGRRSQPQHRSKAPLSASELAAATAAADTAAAELLAEEEAAKAAKAPASTAQGSSSQRRRRKKHGGGASAEPDELDAATLEATMPPFAGAGASAEPSASAKRRQCRIAAKAASHYPPAARPTSPVAAPSPEPALSDAEEQAEPEAPEPLEPAPLPVQMLLPPAPILAPAPAVEDEAARLRRQLEALQLKTSAMEREKKAMESALESQLCSICLDAPRSHVLLPCYHHCLCGSLECFRMLGTPPLCPICRSAVTQTRQIY